LLDQGDESECFISTKPVLPKNPHPPETMKLILLSSVLALLLTAATGFCDVAVYSGNYVGTTVRTDSDGATKTNVSAPEIRILDLSPGRSQMAVFDFFTSNGIKHYAYNGSTPCLFMHSGGPSAGGSKSTVSWAVDKVFPSGIIWNSSVRFLGNDSLVKVSDVSTVSLPKTLKGTSWYLDYTPTTGGAVTRKTDYISVERLNLVLTQKFNNQQLTFDQAIAAMKAELVAQGYAED
jgi:hypothetical protein